MDDVALDPIEVEQQQIMFEREKWLAECEERKRRELLEKHRWKVKENDQKGRPIAFSVGN